jgi:hypothetical protein
MGLNPCSQLQSMRVKSEHTIRMVFGRNLKECWKRLLVLVNGRPDLLCNLGETNVSMIFREKNVSSPTC